MGRTATLVIHKCGECPHHKVGPSYSLDGFDRGNDWTCSLLGSVIVSFVERPSEQPKEVPANCPLLKRKRAQKGGG